MKFNIGEKELLAITWEQCAVFLAWEIAERDKLYAIEIEHGRMTAERARHEIACLMVALKSVNELQAMGARLVRRSVASIQVP